MAQVLETTYTQVTNAKDPYNILGYASRSRSRSRAESIAAHSPSHAYRSLLIRGPEYHSLSREYIELYKLDEARVALLLADTFYRAIIELRFGQVDSTWLNQQFADYVAIVKEPRDVGVRLMELLNANSGTLSYANQAELLVRAHHCFVLSCSLDGAERVIQLVKEKVQLFVEAGEFKLLVRLLTGIQNYRQLQFIFNCLVEYVCCSSRDFGRRRRRRVSDPAAWALLAT